MQKDDGSMMHMLSIIFSTIFVAIILIMYAGISNNINKRNDIDLVARRYLLLMEIEGGLNAELEKELTNELKKLGVENIKLEGTTLVNDDSLTNYGEIITLNIKGDMNITSYNNKNNIFTVTGTTVPINISKSSTSKN